MKITCYQDQGKNKLILDGPKSSQALKDYAFFQLEAPDYSGHQCPFKKVVVVGIGGSSLGIKVLYQALPHEKKIRDFVFLDDLDPDCTQEKLKDLDFDQSLFLIISKSGNTAETLANFSLLYQLALEKSWTEKQFYSHCFFITDEAQGTLSDLAQAHSVSSLSIPKQLGGRYSVLSHVGLYPAFLMGWDVSSFFKGLPQLKKELDAESELVTLANDILSHYPNINQTVFMPYSERLAYLKEWFVQLWAESLGKNNPKTNQPEGLTPIGASGVRDQHSLLQLFVDGPKDKYFILLEVEKGQEDFQFDRLPNHSSFTKFSQHTYRKLQKAELTGTLKSLRSQAPCSKMTITQVNEETLGQTLFSLECLTALVALGLGVNAFDQPGVEESKKFAWEWLQGQKP